MIDPNEFSYWCWIDVIRENMSCRFSVIDMRCEDPLTMLQEGFNTIQDAISWGHYRIAKLNIDTSDIHTRVGFLDEDDSVYRFIHDVMDENTALVVKLMLE